MHRLILCLLSVCLLYNVQAKPTVKTLVSPNGKLQISVELSNDIRWSVTSDGQTIITPSQIAMQIGDGTTWGLDPRLSKASKSMINETIPSPLYKKSQVENHCNVLRLDFKGDYSIEFRAYDNAAAYRFISARDNNYVVKNEISEFKFEKDNNVYCAYASNDANASFEQQYYNSNENTYEVKPMSKMGKTRLLFLPVLVDMGDKKVCITESDLMSYPGMYLYNPTEGTTLTGNYPPVPDKIEQGGHNMLQGEVKTHKPYIAEIKGARSFPWRVCIVADNDAQLLNDDMVFRLSQPNSIGDLSWIKPGKVAWEWWNDWGLYGVDFKPGINNRTYEYYIDFAARNGIEYIILDEGWNVNLKADLMQVIPEIDIKHLVDYGKERGVGVVLWGGYWAVNRDMDNLFKYYSGLGVKGFKIDFMNRDDQYMVDFYERAAATAAKYHLMVDFHGAYKPCGLSRKYPNVINYEGVYGLEQMKFKNDREGTQVVYDVTIPFIRMVAGPLDYTQGAMTNVQKEYYSANYSEPMSQGTRCHQLAMYVIYESPFNMLCDSPSNYEKEPECTRFIAEIPTVWDETVAIDGKVGEYAVLARRHGDKWYIGGLNNWDARNLEIDLSFLPAGQYDMSIIQDGTNADKIARDFRITNSKTDNQQKIRIRMAKGGGFAVKLIPSK